MLDDAAYFAASSVVKDFFMLTTSFSTNILRPVSKGKLTAVGKIRYKSTNLYTAEASLFNEDGKEVAFGTGNFVKSKILLSQEVGYK
jgi:acyl-coenzyme A thioesterase PaaI-like protein